MPRVRPSVMGFALALLGLTFAIVGPADASGASTQKSCGVVHVNGHSVRFGVTSGISCSAVMKHAQVLVKKSLKSHTSRAVISGGPKGWSCIGATYTSPGVGVFITGNCSKGLAFGPGSGYFNWSGS